MTVLPALRLRSLAARLRRDDRGLAMVEYAMSLPVLIGISLYGVETANFAIANLRVNQIATLTADNAGRVRDSIDEADINELLTGAKLVGTGIDFAANGRIILSNLEMRTNGTTNQWIRWQRCSGAKNVTSTYGVPKTSGGATISNATEKTAPVSEAQSTPRDGASSTPTGMGPTGKQVASSQDTAVMFVEVVYDYQPLVTNNLLGPRVIRSVGAFNVRQRTNFMPTNYGDVTPSKCSTFAA